MVDESLIQDTVRAGRLRKVTIRRLIDQIASAETAGADAVLVTCSSIGPGVALARQLFDIPVIRIDDAMAEEAVRSARTIGVLATLRTTLDPTTALLREKAAEAGRTVELVECLCEKAFPAVLAGDTETHDRILREALMNDLNGVDVIVLAQASMARVVDAASRRAAYARALQPGTRDSACPQDAGPAPGSWSRRLKQRHKVLALLGILSVLTFLDRLAIAVAGPGIQSDLHIPPQDWRWILSAYVLAYGLFEMPSGALGDRRGQRGELTRIVTWWSVFTALTGWCRGFWQLVSVRFLFGIGAAGAYPNSAGVIARWFPARERARSQGVIWAASRLGGVLAPLLIVPLQAWFGWRSVFWLLGVVGFLWPPSGTPGFATSRRKIPPSHQRNSGKLVKLPLPTQKGPSPGPVFFTRAACGSLCWLTAATAVEAGSTSPGSRCGWSIARAFRLKASCSRHSHLPWASSATLSEASSVTA